LYMYMYVVSNIETTTPTHTPSRLYSMCACIDPLSCSEVVLDGLRVLALQRADMHASERHARGRAAPHACWDLRVEQVADLIVDRRDALVLGPKFSGTGAERLLEHQKSSWRAASWVRVEKTPWVSKRVRGDDRPPLEQGTGSDGAYGLLNFVNRGNRTRWAVGGSTRLRGKLACVGTLREHRPKGY
jgi:hypothetical protein